MSLDSLFEQILLAEQQVSEHTQKLSEVKVAIIRCSEKIKSATEKCDESTKDLDEKARRSSELELRRDLMKKGEDQMLQRIEELRCQQSLLGERRAEIKRQRKEEEENFLREISRFNGDFGLRGSNELVFESRNHAEIRDLDREADSLYEEMELMSRGNGRLRSMQEEERALRLQLQELENLHRDLDRQLKEAEAATASLRAERLLVSQKPSSDSACLRLRKELELQKEEELELLREALRSEILVLKLRLDGSQQH